MSKKYNFILIYLLSISLCCIAYSDIDQAKVIKANAFFNDGIKAESQHKLDKASRLFHKALKYNPLLPGAWVELGKIEIMKKNPQKAVEFYLKARKVYIQLHDEKVKSLAKKQMQERDWVQKGKDAGKGTFGGYAKNAAEQVKEYNMENNRQVVHANPAEQDIPALFYLYLGGAYMRLGQNDRAERELLRGIKHDPKLAPLHFDLAVIYLIEGKYMDAVREARLAKKNGFKLPSQFVKDLETRSKMKL